MSQLYGVLGVARRADSAQIKTAFRKKAKACHPDLHGGDKAAEERFKEINLAYETLGKPEARAHYDAVCAQERALRWRHIRSAAATMTASFCLTVSSGALVGMWLLSEGVL
jgi:curved DNA-binding protein CbpA